ncbi:hypothetical protein GCM10020331_016560 [Ectobacillus funiculus]
MRKQLLPLLLGLLLIVALAGCGQKTKEDVISDLKSKGREYEELSGGGGAINQKLVQSRRYIVWRFGTASLRIIA